MTGQRHGNTFAATSSLASDGQYSCKATVTGLKHGTTYYYQLSNNGKAGQIYSFTTYRVSDMSVIDSFTIKKNSGTQTANPIIEQIYGGGGKGETPISNSFIEIYNPCGEEIDLSAYSLKYGDKTLNLNGVIPANGSYLVVGEAETTTDEFLTYDLPDADQSCDWTINNKSYTKITNSMYLLKCTIN